MVFASYEPCRDGEAKAREKFFTNDIDVVTACETAQDPSGGTYEYGTVNDAFGPLQFMKLITRKLVRINHPFRIADRNWTYPAGEYEITTEEEELGGGSYRHLRTTIYVPKSKGSLASGSLLRLALGSLTRSFGFSRARQKQPF
jgi:hypothetical protein